MPLTLAGSSAREKRARTSVEGETPEASGAGVRLVTVSGAWVVKLQLAGFAIAVPSPARMPVENVIVKRVLVASRWVGLKVTWRFAES